MALSADKILSHSGVFKTREVHVPAWADESGDDVVHVRGMTVREFELNQATLGERPGTATAALVARCVVDDKGTPIFKSSQVDAIAELGFAEINEIGRVITELSGLSDDAKEDIKGNSDADPSDSSSSGSPAGSAAPSES